MQITGLPGNISNLQGGKSRALSAIFAVCRSGSGASQSLIVGKFPVIFQVYSVPCLEGERIDLSQLTGMFVAFPTFFAVCSIAAPSTMN